MGQRNMRNTNQMINLDHDQQAQFHLHPEPCPQPCRNIVLPVIEPVTGLVRPHQSGSFENTIPYGMAQYSGIHQHPLAGNPGMGLATTSNFYNPYVIPPPSSSVFPPQVNQGHQFVDDFGGAFKSKSGAGYLGNFQYCNSVAGPSSAGPLGLVGGETVLAHNPNNLMQGNYSVQTLIPDSAPWLDQRYSGNGGDGGTQAWGQAPSISYIQGSAVNSGFAGMGNMVTECYQEPATSSISTNLHPHAPPLYPQGHPQSLHHLPQPMQGPFYPQISSTSYGFARNSALQANMNTFQVGTEVGLSFVGPVPSGVAVFQPSRGRALLPAATLRHHTGPHFNLLPADEVAMLEIPGYYEMGNAIDHHRDMRMDVDSMSYEELLALEEHIGAVGVGLSEDTISNHLKTRTHVAATDSVELEDRETDFCAICQTNYEDQEKIGTLDCGHEYHVDCVKTWLIIKNTCPICKSSALTIKRKDSKREG